MEKAKKSKPFGETLLCALSYFFPIWVFGIFFIKRSKRIHYHISQAINLSITTLLYFMVTGIIGFVFNFVSWRFSYVSGLLSVLVAVLYLLLVILALVRVIRRSNKPLPLVIRFVVVR